MTAPLFLLAFAVAASTVGRLLLLRAVWPQRAPRLGIWTWQVLAFSVAAAILLAGAALSLPVLPVRIQIADLARIAPIEIAEHYATPGGQAAAVLALALTLALLGRLLWFLANGLRTARRGQRKLIDGLALLGAPHVDGYTVVDHPVPIVYSIPGRGGRIVVTSGAVGLLANDELLLVLAHERAHLRARHDLALVCGTALTRTFGPLRIFQIAKAQVTALAEMHADDAVVRLGDRRVLARALATMGATSHASAEVPTSTAPATCVAARIGRLRAAQSPLGAPRTAAVALTTSALLSLPLALALAPALEAAARECCAESVVPGGQPD